MDNIVNVRLAQAYDTEANWLHNADFTPACGEIVFFAPDDKHKNLRMKVGDGKLPLSKLQFFGLVVEPNEE